VSYSAKVSSAVHLRRYCFRNDFLVFFFFAALDGTGEWMTLPLFQKRFTQYPMPFSLSPRLPGYDGAIKTVVILVCVSLSRKVQYPNAPRRRRKGNWMAVSTFEADKIRAFGLLSNNVCVSDQKRTTHTLFYHPVTHTMCRSLVIILFSLPVLSRRRPVNAQQKKVRHKSLLTGMAAYIKEEVLIAGNCKGPRCAPSFLYVFIYYTISNGHDTKCKPLP
jgi:hypothetical protein